MIITYHGNQCLKLQLGDMTVAVNPISKDSKLKPVRFGADICLISINHPDTNGSDQVGYGEKQPFVISGPGEYETKGIFIKGFASHSSYGGEEKINTIYTLTLDNISMCLLGALDTANLPAETKGMIEEADILITPIGGEGTLTPQDAYKLAVQFQPKAIIPTGYENSKDALKTFMKEGGGQDVKPIDKLTVKRKDLEGKEGEIIVLSQS